MSMAFSEAERRCLFLQAFSKMQDTPMSSYAYDAVTKAYGESPIWSQWMGAALSRLKIVDKSSIDDLIAENQKIAAQTKRPAYQDSDYGGWSTLKASSFIGCQPDLHFCYVLDGGGVGYAMAFPKEPQKWTIPDSSAERPLNYHLWGNSDHIFRITLGISFNELQDHKPHRERFEVAATKLITAAVPNVETTDILRNLKLLKPFRRQIGRIELNLDNQYFNDPREPSTRTFVLRLRHLDNRSKIKMKLDEWAHKSKAQPTLGGGEMYQTSSLRLCLFKFGCYKKRHEAPETGS